MRKSRKHNELYNQGKRYLFLLIWIMFGLASQLQAQDGGGDTSDDQSKIGEELDQFANRFLDWIVLSYATYTGQHEAELESIFAKAKEALDNQSEVRELLRDLMGSSDENSLEQVVRDFTNQTGIGVYFVPQIANENDGFYVPIFNNFLAEGAKNPIAPFVIVKPLISGNHRSGYQVSYTLETSPDLNAKKYNLDQADTNNPFHPISGSVAQRKGLAERLKPNLAAGVKILTENVDENFLPKLVITYDGNVYRPGEEIEMGMEAAAEIRLIAMNRDGSEPKRNVVWSFAPETVERKVRGSDLVFPLSTAGRWAILAESGSLKATVGVKVVDFNLDWREVLKAILKEVVNESIATARFKIDSLANDTLSYTTEIQQQRNVLLEREGYTVNSSTATVSSDIYFEEVDDSQNMTQSELDAFMQDEQAKAYVELHRKWYIVTAQILLQLNIEVFLNALIDDPKRLDDFVSEVKNSSPELIISLITNLSSRPDGRLDIKNLIINHLNKQIQDAAFNE
ncbi:MAG: hypothetical protein ABJF11_03720 [Reichenbachiella sp.]|uniref:hypothetical protein n=1 Tax=Reichenbachiella sp. TaxID=2184521 RepID=UPI003263B1A6